LFDYFGILSPIYDRLIRLKDPQRLLSVLELPQEGKLLDAGGGTGRIAISLCPYTSQVIIADISYQMLTQAKRKDGLKPVCTPSEKLPFPDNLFDRIIMVDALHHVENASSTVAELWRVTKPGGRIVIEEPDIRAISVKFIALFEKLILMRSHFLSPSKIADLFSFSELHPLIKTQGYTAWIVINKPASI